MVPHLPPREVLNSSQEIILFFLGVFLWFTGCSYPQIFRNPKYFQLPGPQRQDKRDRESIGKEYTFDGCHINSPSQILKVPPCGYQHYYICVIVLHMKTKSEILEN